MARVLGVGGVFFKSPDPVALSAWYEKWLKVPVESTYGAMFQPQVMPEGGFTVWGPFKASTSYFDPSNKEYMFNLVVDDLDGALAQVQQGGAQLSGEVEEHDFGRFGWFMDPDGNKVELWEPV
jgi:predicted enzyme related to lactoylglutathione lyase